MVGLCLAVDRWDPTVSTPFVAFAGPTISGEIKRHFRDRAWLVRPPRSVQNRVADVRAATEELMAELGRDATREEIAARLDVEVDLVDDAPAGRRRLPRHAHGARRRVSRPHPTG